MKSRSVVLLIISALVLSGIIILWRSSHKEGIVRKPAVVKGAKVERPVTPAKKAKVAIVMDDFGYNMNNLDNLFSIGQPVTLSILPNLPYSKEITHRARRRGYEVILHLPLEAHGKSIREEVDTIKSGMSSKEVNDKLSKDIASVPGLTGVSNHMGSKATEDTELMETIFRYLKKRGLYFFDSLTSNESVCPAAAKSIGIKCARRDVFLDNEDTAEYIRKQTRSLERLALKRGRAIAICHDRKNTIAVLSKAMPEMAEKGIEFVNLKDMVK